MNKFFKMILKRIKEPSTMAGLSALAVIAGVPPGTFDLAVQIVAAVAATAAVILPETTESQ